MKRLAIRFLWELCGFLDHIPAPLSSDDGWHWHRHGQLGCLLGLSGRALDLETRWGVEA